MTQLSHDQLRVLAAQLCPDASDPQRAYEILTEQLRRYFEWRRCESPDDLAQETLTRGCAKLAGGVTLDSANPSGYFWGIGRNLLHEYRRQARTRATETLAGDVRATVTGIERAESRLDLAQAMSILSREERLILLRYYLGDRARLRAELGKSDATLRVYVFRLRQQVLRFRAAMKQKSPPRQ